MVAVKSNHINGENEIAFSGINLRSHVRVVLEPLGIADIKRIVLYHCCCLGIRIGG